MNQFPSSQPSPARGEGVYRKLAGLDRFSEWVVAHLIAIINVLLGAFVILPWASPLLMAVGLRGVSEFINRIYVAFCHQLPERSYFVFGYQVAHCHRCVAFYGSIFVGGIIYTRVRNRLARRDRWGQVRYVGLSIPMTVLLCLPIVVDALTHTFGLREAGAALGWLGQSDAIGSANWWLRVVTGMMAGFALAFAIWPRLDSAISRNMDYAAYHRNVQPRNVQQQGA